MTPRIIVAKRAVDYHACIEGQPERWTADKTMELAIRSLWWRHPESKSLNIWINPDDCTDGKARE